MNGEEVTCADYIDSMVDSNATTFTANIRYLVSTPIIDSLKSCIYDHVLKLNSDTLLLKRHVITKAEKLQSDQELQNIRYLAK